MRYSTRPRYSGFYSGYFTNGIKFLLISNIALFIIYYFSTAWSFRQVFLPFELIPYEVVHHFAIWQLVTYMFLHDPNGFGHILFNMLALWMFGSDLERTWGTRRFLKFYFLCGIGAGVCVVLANLIFNSDNLQTRTIGASGAIYGLLLAFGMLFPDRELLFFFLFPIKAKYFVMIVGAIAFMLSVTASGGNISHVAHLGGMIFGYIYMKTWRSGLSIVEPVQRWYREYKLQRAKRKFQVYLKKQGSDKDRWVH